METNVPTHHLNAVVQQITNNTTSWIGQHNGEKANRISGQTFTCPTEGDLDCIEVLSTHVAHKGAVDLSIHTFNPENRCWGPELGSSTVEFNRSNTGKWISFPLKGLHLQKGMTYAFRLKSENALVGVGEAAGSVNHKSFNVGQEWVSTSDEQPGYYFNYMSLAFKVDLRA